MKIKVKQKHYKQLIQCIYLGELMINEYLDNDKHLQEYTDFVEDIFKQIIESAPNIKSKLNLSNIKYERTEDTLLSDLTDRVFDSVAVYYDEYRKAVFCDILAEIIANKNYSVIDCEKEDCFDNILAKNLYFKLLRNAEDNSFVNITAVKINKQLIQAKRKINS